MQNKNANTAYRQSLRGKIVKVATQLFHQHGVKAVKMDDIANRLSISKRTVYEIYANKEELLYEVVLTHEHDVHNALEAFAVDAHDVIDIVTEFYRLQITELAQVNPLFVEDLHKYPRLIEMLRSLRSERGKHAGEFMRRGVEEGYFRHDINFELIHNLADGINGYIMSSFLYKKYPFNEIFRNIVLVTLRGICTEKGIRRIDHFLQSTL